MRPIIYQTYAKRVSSRCYTSIQFPFLKFHRITEQKFSPYMVENSSSAIFEIRLDKTDIPTNEDDITGFENVEGTVRPIDEFDELVVEIHRCSGIEEIICRQVAFSQRKSNYIGKGLTFESELYMSPVITDNDYNLRFDKDIILSSDCTDIIIYSYFRPRPLPIDNFIWNLNPRYKPVIKSKYDSLYKHYGTSGYGIRDLITHLNIEERINDKIILLSFSKVVNEREYTVISHSSMDPGPDEVSEWTEWKIILCLQFSTRKEIYDFLSSVGVVCNLTQYMTLKPKPITHHLKFDTPKSLSEIEQMIGYKFIEEWTTESVRT